MSDAVDLVIRAAQALQMPTFRIVGVDSSTGACRCPKGAACPSPGKHPRTTGWQGEATLDADVIRRWKWPGNFGIKCGGGRVVVDLDGEQGLESWMTLLEETGEPCPLDPVTPTANTGGGGTHFIFGVDVKVGNRVKLLPKLDIRGDGGLIVCAPSLHRSGRRYEWRPGLEPWTVPVAPLPAVLLERILSKGAPPSSRGTTSRDRSAAGAPPGGTPSPQPRPPGGSTAPRAAGTREEKIAAAAVETACDRIRGATSGSRNHTLNREAFGIGQLAAGGLLDEDTAAAALRAAALSISGPDFTEAEIDFTLRHALAEGSLQPRRPGPRLAAPPPPRDEDAPPGRTYALRPAAGGDPHRPERADAPATPPRPPPPPSAPPSNSGPVDRPEDREEIVIRSDLAAMEEEFAAIAARRLHLYRRSGRLVEMVEDDEGARIVAVEVNRGLVLASRAARWLVRTVKKKRLPLPRLAAVGGELVGEVAPAVAEDEGEEVTDAPKRPDRQVVTSWLNRGTWPFPLLRGISGLPIMRPDGTWSNEPGYDPKTGWWWSGLAVRDVGADRDKARRALDFLEEPLSDFPFRNDQHKWAAVAGIMTTVLRSSIEGPAPITILTGHTRGSGKTKIANIASLLATGRSAPITPLTKNDDETHKKITSAIFSSTPVVVFDNQIGTFGSPSLDAALTGDVWSDRMFQTQVLSPPIPIRVAWWATGNNMQVRGDLDRRCLYVYLDSPEERPEDRSDFKHQDLEAWVSAKRADLCCAVFTIAAAYLRAGAPPVEAPPKGSYARWDLMVRRPLLWLTYVDPCASAEDLREEADPHTAGWRQALEAWAEAYGSDEVTAASVARDCTGAVVERFRPLRDALSMLVPDIEARHLGKLFSARKGMRLGGFRLMSEGHGRRGNSWKVERGGQR